MDKVKFFCSNIYHDEWSGVLFYTVKGSVRRPSTMKIVVEDIFLMNKGTAGFTSFQTDTKIVKYMMDNPKLRNMHWGLIHSHNNMKVWFSGEDWDELQLTTPLYNFYLSLIVNNRGEMVAKVCTIGKTTGTAKFMAKDEKGELYMVHSSEYEEDVLFNYNCDITKPESGVVVPESHQLRLNEILEQDRIKREEAAAKAKSFPIKNNPMYNMGLGVGSITPDIDSWSYPREEDTPFIETKAISNEDEDWATRVVRLGNPVTGDDLDTALEDLIESKIDSSTFVSSILDNYIAWYEHYYQKLPDMLNTESIINSIESVLLIFADYEEDYPILSSAETALRAFGNKLSQQLTQQL